DEATPWSRVTRWTIGRQLALLVLATVVPFAALGVYWAISDYHSEQARTQARALRLAHEVSAEVDQFIADTGALVEAMARVPSVKRAEQPQANQLLDELAKTSSVLIVDRAGRIVARRTSPEEWVGRSALDSTAVRDALRLKEGVAEGDFVDGVRRLSGFAGATRVPWEVIVGIPTDE